MANTDAVAPAGLPHGDSAGTFLGHPKGLFVLFFAEMWERFSYYGMRALLIFYLTKHWLFSDGDSGLIYGAYTALVYITPVVGGYLADKYIGQRKAVLFGAVLLTFGHFFMAFEGQPGAGNADNPIIYVFWLALALIIVGSGFLKANISVMVGQLYPRTDVRRDGAYTIFYMGINLGAALGSLLCGYIGETYGWAYGFGLAGIGMLAGLIVFIWGKPLLLGRGEPPKAIAKGREMSVYGIGLVLVAICWVAIQYQDAVGVFLGTFGAALVCYVLSIAVFQIPYKGYANAPHAAKYAFAALAGLLTISMFFVSRGDESWQLPALIGAGGVLTVMVLQMVAKTDHDRDRIVAAMFLITVSIIFWALFEQAGSSLNLFTDRHVDRGSIPTTFFQSINPIYIILLGPVFAGLWQWMAKKGIEPSTPAKMGLGIVQMGLAFVVMVWGAENFSSTGEAGALMMPVLFLFIFYLLSTTGELCLSPVGLSAMNRLSAKHMASLMMAAFFFGTAGGNYVAGFMGSLMGEGEGGNMTREGALEAYWTMGLVAVGVGLVVMVVSPLVKKLMHLDTLKDDDAHIEGEAEAGLEVQEAGLSKG